MSGDVHPRNAEARLQLRLVYAIANKKGWISPPCNIYNLFIKGFRLRGR